MYFVVLYSSTKAKETIRYDEYMNSGIPDLLLEGLGFFKNSEIDNEDGNGSEVNAEMNKSSKEVLPKTSSKLIDNCYY
jgi:hypothetical protein